MKQQIGIGLASLVAVTTLTVALASAKPAYLKQAKDAGFPAQNCTYCHTDKSPKKDTFKPDDLNARGKFLFSEKQKRNAKDIDVAWLKEYKE